MEVSEAKKVLEQVLKDLTIDVKKIEVIAEDPHTLLSVTTPDSGILIGPQGENLRALNYVVKKIVEVKVEQPKTPTLSFLVDVNGYHRKHLMRIKQQARMLAERARMYKSDIAMDPLNAYERMIVHADFANDQDIITESSGVGSARHIVFKYKRDANETPTRDKELFSDSVNS